MSNTKISEPTIFSSNKEFIKQVLSLKFFYVFSVFICLFIAFALNKYAKQEHETFALISPIKNQTTSVLSSSELFRGLQAFRAYNDIEDEINNLKSFSIISSTINRLNLEVGYFVERRRILKETKELYTNAPFIVTLDKSKVQPINVKFYVDILSDSTFRLVVDQSDVSLYNYVDNRIVSNNNLIKIDTVSRFNETIDSRNFRFNISQNSEFRMDDEESEYRYYFEFYDLDNLAKAYLNNMDVYRLSQASSILRVQLRGENLGKAINFLNNYLLFYFEENLSKKNKMAVSTINFIDNQLSDISDSLVLSETRLRDFRSRFQVMDLGYQGQMIYEQLQKLEEEINKLNTHERYYNFLLDYFRSNPGNDMSGIVLPSAMNVEDPLVTQLISELLSLNAERLNIINNRGADSPFLSQINSRINTQKQAITENVNNNLNTMRLTLNELDYRAERLSQQISNLPRTELNMVNMQRKFNVDDELYTYLLQKRSEAAISMASNFPDYEIVEPAREITSNQVAPKAMFNYMIALFLGLLIPTATMVGREFLNTKIHNIQFIEITANRPVIGVIYENDSKDNNVLINNPLSAVSESFRILKNTIQIKNKTKGTPKKILVTSPQPEDGKSFISYNFAVSLAMAGHKTVIIDGDLRRPTLHKKFGMENKQGISNILMKDMSLNNILHNTNIDNLIFVPSGPVLPSPVELLESGVLDALIEFLEKDYEYIIIDSPPIGMLSDTLLLVRNVTQTLLVARHNHTRKDIFSDVINKLELNNIDSFDIVYNDTSLKESPYELYGNYYNKKAKKRIIT